MFLCLPAQAAFTPLQSVNQFKLFVLADEIQFTSPCSFFLTPSCVHCLLNQHMPSVNSTCQYNGYSLISIHTFDMLRDRGSRDPSSILLFHREKTSFYFKGTTFYLFIYIIVVDTFNNNIE